MGVRRVGNWRMGKFPFTPDQNVTQGHHAGRNGMYRLLKGITGLGSSSTTARRLRDTTGSS